MVVLKPSTLSSAWPCFWNSKRPLLEVVSRIGKDEVRGPPHIARRGDQANAPHGDIRSPHASEEMRGETGICLLAQADTEEVALLRDFVDR